MRWFTDAANAGEGSKWDEAVAAYAAHLAAITAKLPEALVALASDPGLDLHDGRFHEVTVDREAQDVALVINCGELQLLAAMPNGTGQRRWRQAAILATALLVAAACSRGPSSPAPTEDLTPSPLGESPAVPTTTTISVDIPGEGGTTLTLTIADRSGLVRFARSATLSELRAQDDLLSTSTIAAANLTAQQLLIVWLGSSCDRTATLHIHPRLTGMTLENGPRPSCDLAANPRGVVLNMSDGIRADQVTVELALPPSP